MSTDRLMKRPRAAARGLPIGAARRALWLVLAGAPAFAADAFSTDWAPSAKSQSRLIAGRGDLAGFEIALSPGAITYWRDPGDAGLPPTLDFSGSDNVASVAPEFPAPKRIKEADGGEAFGYDGDVVFPLAVKLRDPAKPATLKLDADFAVCEKVCLPAKAHLELKLPSVPGSPHAAAIDAALASVPRAVQPKDFGALEAHRRGSLAALLSPGERPAARPVRRGAGGLVAEDGARAGRRRPRLLHSDNRRQTERRRLSRGAQAHAHRRRGRDGDDDPGRAENLRRPPHRATPPALRVKRPSSSL